MTVFQKYNAKITLSFEYNDECYEPIDTLNQIIELLLSGARSTAVSNVSLTLNPKDSDEAQ